ncbi:MAG: peptidoglycan DD-metalloendopeptidase family protein [Marmoricola sp.]
MRSTGTGTPHRRRRLVRALSLTGAVTALLTPVLLAGSSSGAPSVVRPVSAASTTVPAASRVSLPPNVTYPIAATAAPQDLRTYSSRTHGTDIAAPCGTPVLASFPGTAHVLSGHKWSGPVLVKVDTTHGRLTAWYGYLDSASVTSGQIVQAGQPLGEVGRQGNATGCELHFEVRTDNGKTIRNTTSWLEGHVGAPIPTSYLFGNRGFMLASFNLLGASHTAKGGDNTGYPVYTTRMPKAIALLESRNIDVAGLQEFQKPQHAMFRSLAGNTFATYPADETTDTENSIVWRKSAFDLVSANKFDVTYFDGSTRHMPYVLLRQRSTGLTSYFINVHNPANTAQYKHRESYRARAIAAEKALIISLRQTGRPVFLTGDLNDRAAAFCPLTAGKLMLSADSVPSMSCALPPGAWIDWVLAAGQARFATYTRDWSTKTDKISDHPIVYTRAHLAG